MSIINTDDYFTTPQAASRLGLTADSVKKYCQRGRIVATWIGNQWLIHRREIARYKRSRRPYNRKESLKNPPPETSSESN